MNRRVQETGGLRHESGFRQKNRGSHREPRFLLCKSIADYEMRHVPAPAGQVNMMRKCFMRCSFATFRGAPERMGVQRF